MGQLQLSMLPESLRPDMFSSLLISPNSIINFLLFLSITFSITSAVLIGRMNRAIKNYDFKSYAKNFSHKTGMIFTLVQPFLFVLNIFSVSSDALSFSFFITSLIILSLMLLISTQFYMNFKSRNQKSTTIVFSSLLLFTILIYNMQNLSETIERNKVQKVDQTLEIFS